MGITGGAPSPSLSLVGQDSMCRAPSPGERIACAPGESQRVKHHREAKTTIRRRINEEDFTKIGELLVSCD